MKLLQQLGLLALLDQYKHFGAFEPYGLPFLKACDRVIPGLHLELATD